MGLFDNYLGNWIQIIDEQNSKTIDDYGYNTGVIEGTTENHCVKCVAVNKCWFKNEKNKKPENFDLNKINIVEYISNNLLPGLYHPRCHCQEIPIQVTGINQIQLIIPDGKIGWLIKDKAKWLESMGYDCDGPFIEYLIDKIKQSYYFGNYYIQSHTNFGVKIKLNIDIDGKNEKKEKIYKLISSFTVFPNGKIKCNTLIGGWQK